MLSMPCNKPAATPGFVYFVGQNTTKYIFSKDGISWGVGDMPAANYYNGAFGNNQYVAAIKPAAATATSPDGNSFVTGGDMPASPGGASSIPGMAYGGGVYVAIDSAYNFTAITSTDGTTWASYQINSDAFGTDVCFNGSVFCMVGIAALSFNSDFSATSPDGVTWTYHAQSSAFNPSAIAWNGSVFCVLSNGSTGSYTSPDGITWTHHATLADSGLTAIKWNGTVFCALSSTGNGYTSPDGITWTTQTLATATAINSLAWNGTVFCAGMAANGHVQTSPDGLTWTDRATGAPFVMDGKIISNFLVFGTY